jgi:hypothetical protein
MLKFPERDIGRRPSWMWCSRTLWKAERCSILRTCALSRRLARREWFRFETPASGGRGAAGAHKSLKKTLLCAIVNSAETPYANYKIDHAMICRRLVMTNGYIVADVAIKTAYFSLVAAAFIFVSMLLLAGVHP